MIFKMNDKGACQIDGINYPAVGFGTYPLQGEICFNAVTHAGKLGYRIIDTATFYQNLTEIGKVLKILIREQFYIISKVWPDSQTPEGLRKDIQSTLSQLQTAYLDAYLIHWPNHKIPIEKTLSTMAEFRNAGLIRHIGFSNVTVNHLKRILELKIPIEWVQIEMHPFFYDPALLQFCQEKLIAVQAWAPLAQGRISDDPLLNQLAKRYGKTVAQVCLNWIVQHHCVPLPGSQNEQHIKQNLDINDFRLSPEDMNAIDSRAAIGQRLRITPDRDLGFTDEFDFSYDQCWPKAASP